MLSNGCIVIGPRAVLKMPFLDIIMWLHENRTEGCTKNAIYEAVRNGHLGAVEFLSVNRTEFCIDEAIDIAREWGHTDILQYLVGFMTSGEWLYYPILCVLSFCP